MTRARLAVVALVATLTLLLSGCGPFPWDYASRQHNEWIYGLHFTQFQAVPDFDDAEYFIEDGNDVNDFIALLKKHNVRASTYVGPDTSGCTGGLSTQVTIDFHAASSHDITIDSCGLADDTFEAEANAFFSAWREGHPNFEYTNDTITAVTFAQSQAIEGFDDHPYRQSDDAEVARFIALLDEFGVTASEYDDPADEPCEGGLSAEATIEYTDAPDVAEITIDGCTADDGFAAAALDLLTEWREQLSQAQG